MTEDQSRRKFDGIEWKILGWLMDAICVGIVAFTVNLNIRITDLEMWKAATTANRYTSQDHLLYAASQAKESHEILSRMSDMQMSWSKDIGEIKTTLAVIPQMLESPPKWWGEYAKPAIQSNSDRIKELENEIRKGRTP